LPFDLCLLLFESVNEDRAQAIVFDAFDLAFLVAGDEQWLGRGDLLGDQAEVVRLAIFPVEGYRAQAIDKIPDGPIMAKMSKIIKPPVGDIYHSIESPKGELGYYIVSDGSTAAYRARVRPPSYVNLQSLKKMVVGHMVADVVAVIGTLDIVLGEIDR